MSVTSLSGCFDRVLHEEQSRLTEQVFYRQLSCGDGMVVASNWSESCSLPDTDFVL